MIDVIINDKWQQYRDSVLMSWEGFEHGTSGTQSHNRQETNAIMIPKEHPDNRNIKGKLQRPATR